MDADKFVRECWCLHGTAVIFVALRYYSRVATTGWRKLALDDLLMAIAIILYTAQTVAAYMTVEFWHGFANNAMTDEYRAALSPTSEEWALRISGSKTHVAGQLLYMTVLWTLKACWVVYYARLTNHVHYLERVMRGAYFIIPLTYVACLLVDFLKCIPFEKLWQINPKPGNQCMPAIAAVQTVFVMTLNTMTDFYLMSIPLPAIVKARMPMRKKLVLMIAFSGALLEMAFGIMRCVAILTLGDKIPAQVGHWSMRESFVAVLVTNMPIVYPLVKKFLEEGIRRVSGFPNNAASRVSSIRGHPLEHLSRRSTQSRRVKDPFSVPEDIVTGSTDQEEGDAGGTKAVDATRRDDEGVRVSLGTQILLARCRGQDADEHGHRLADLPPTGLGVEDGSSSEVLACRESDGGGQPSRPRSPARIRAEPGEADRKKSG